MTKLSRTDYVRWMRALLKLCIEIPWNKNGFYKEWYWALRSERFRV